MTTSYKRDVKMKKLKRTYSLDEETVKKIEKNAEKQDRNRSNLVNKTLKENLK